MNASETGVRLMNQDTHRGIPITPEQLRKAGQAYVGWRSPEGTQVWVVGPEPDQAHPLSHVTHHSPTGMEWGYGGSGPADLSLSILSHCLRGMLTQLYGDANQAPESSRNEAFQAALDLHQQFKWHRIAPLKADRWVMPAASVRQWLWSMTVDLATPSATRSFVATLLELTGTEARAQEAASL